MPPDVPSVDSERISIPTAEDQPLAATRFEADGSAGAHIVLHSALAIPRGFYAEFSSWMARRGFEVLTYDYRGIGDSAPRDLGRCDATVGDWARIDMPAAIDWAQRHLTGERTFLVGHSLGGQIAGLLGDRHSIDGMVTISAQSGYWRRQYPGHEWRVYLGMRYVFPALTRLCGYLPWSLLFGGTDIPKPAALQWARWCLDPDYLMGDPRLDARASFDRFRAPIRAYSFEDDVWGARGAVDWMMSQYRSSSVERIHVLPGDVGLDRIGHFGFFRSRLEPLWRELLDRLRSW